MLTLPAYQFYLGRAPGSDLVTKWISGAFQKSKDYDSDAYLSNLDYYFIQRL